MTDQVSRIDARAAAKAGPRGTFRMSIVQGVPEAEATPVDPPRFDLEDLRRQAAEEARAGSGPRRIVKVDADDESEAPKRPLHPVFAGAAAEPHATSLIPQVGDRLMHYRVVDTLNQGGMALLYEVEHELIGKRFALKVLRPEHAQNQITVARFVAEFRVTHELRGHPNLVDVHELGFDNRFGHFIVMELLRGHSLRELIRIFNAKGQRIPFELALQWVVLVAETLHATHQLGVVHRDIKPDNIFIERSSAGEDRVIVLDWGCAKSKHGPSTTDQSNAAATALYMSPEQAERKRITGQSDQFSLNHVLYELVADHAFARAISDNPYNASLYAGWQRWSTIEPPPRHLTTPALTAILMRAFQKNPSDRFDSLDDYAAALREVIKSGVRPLTAPQAKGRPRTVPTPNPVAQIDGLPMTPLPATAEPMADEDGAPRDEKPVLELSADYPEPTLVIIGPEALFGKRYALGEAGIIGSGVGVCDIVIDHPTISKRHLSYNHITGGVGDPVYGVADMSRTNRVEVARSAMRATASSICKGETVRLGDVHFAIAPAGPVVYLQPTFSRVSAEAEKTEQLPRPVSAPVFGPPPAAFAKRPEAPLVAPAMASATAPAHDRQLATGQFVWHVILGGKTGLQLMLAGFIACIILGLLLLDWMGRLGGVSLFHGAP